MMNFALGVLVLWLGAVAVYLGTRPGTLRSTSPFGIYQDLLEAIGGGKPIPTVDAADQTPSAEAPSQPSVTARVPNTPYGTQFAAAGQRYQIDPDLLSAIARQESNYNPTAVSPAGAKGLMQVMPFHWKSGENAFDPVQSINKGASIFKSYLAKFNGDITNALRAYNVGPAGNLSSAKGYSDSVLGYYRRIKAGERV